jgi:hypothetical protein
MCCHISCPSNMGFARLDSGLWEMANYLGLKWYKSCLRPLEVLDVNGRHLGFTFLTGPND